MRRVLGTFDEPLAADEADRACLREARAPLGVFVSDWRPSERR